MQIRGYPDPQYRYPPTLISTRGGALGSKYQLSRTRTRPGASRAGKAKSSGVSAAGVPDAAGDNGAATVVVKVTGDSLAVTVASGCSKGSCCTLGTELSADWLAVTSESRGQLPLCRWHVSAFGRMP